MSEKKIYQLAFANFLCAFGGGAVLGKATKLVSIDGKPIGSIFAFFIGTTIGLFLMEIASKYFSKKAPRWYSLLTGLASLLVLALVLFSSSESLSGLLGVFGLLILSFRFCFWFLSRIFRSNVASSAPHLLPLFEGSYVAGSILGLLLFGVMFQGVFGVKEILLLDLICAFIAFFIDFPVLEQEKSSGTREGGFFSSVFSLEIFPPLSMFCLLSVGVQVCLFQLSKFWNNGLFLIIGFYSGMAVASVLVAKLRIDCKGHHSSVHIGSKVFDITFWAFGASLIVFSVIFYLSQDLLAKSAALMFVMSLIFALIYEVFGLGLVQNISVRAKAVGFINPVARSYALMALASATTIACYIGFELDAPQIFYVSIGLLILSMVMNIIDRKNILLSSEEGMEV